MWCIFYLLILIIFYLFHFFYVTLKCFTVNFFSSLSLFFSIFCSCSSLFFFLSFIFFLLVYSLCTFFFFYKKKEIRMQALKYWFTRLRFIIYLKLIHNMLQFCFFFRCVLNKTKSKKKDKKNLLLNVTVMECL